jgi:hypothetical protein
MKLKKGNNQLQEDEFRRLYQVKAEKLVQPNNGSKHLFNSSMRSPHLLTICDSMRRSSSEICVHCSCVKVGVPVSNWD